jgi:hypothetical protein
MTVEELARKVLKMRRAQKEYFRTRSSAVLEESKRLEKQVDQVVDEVLTQPRLFTES